MKAFDPRLFARDYEGSDLAEVPIPGGVVPSAILGVYRLAEYNAQGNPTSQPQAFNYYRPLAAGGISQLIVDAPTSARITGLRVGLGRGVAVVVVATVGGATRVFGVPSARRVAFLDVTSPSSTNPPDPNVLKVNWTPPVGNNFYVVVAIDSALNWSDSSAVVPGQAFAPVPTS